MAERPFAANGKRPFASDGSPSKHCATLDVSRGLRMDATLQTSLDQSLIVLSRRDLAALVPFKDYVEAVAAAFRLHAQGRAVAPAPLHVPAEGGGFHVKAGSLPLASGYAAFKINANFPDNRRLNALPT